MRRFKMIGMNDMNEPKDKRQKVLDTTLELIMEHGVQATSMSKVSKASGVAVGTIYHYFSSKEAIITELYRHFKMKMLQSMLDAVGDESDAIEAFALAVLGLLDFSTTYPYALEFCETFSKSPIVDEKIRGEVASKFLESMAVMVDNLKNQGHIEKASDEMMYVYLNGTVFSMVRAHSSGEINWSEEEVRQFLGMVWKGLAPD